MRVLLVEDEADLLDVYAFWFESEHGATTVRAKSVDEARKALEAGPAFEFIMTDFRLPDGTSKDFLADIRRHSPSAPVLLCSGSPRDSIPITDDEVSAFLAKPFRFDDLRALLQEVLAPRLDQSARAADAPRFCALGLGTLRNIGVLPFELHMRLGPDKTVKVLNEGAIFDEGERKRFMGKDVEVLLAPAEKVRAFAAKEADTLLRLAVEPSLKSNVVIAQSTLALVASMAKELKLPPEADALARRILDFTICSVQETPKINEALDAVLKYPESYLASHSVALAHIACAMAHHAGWDSDLTLYKICMTSLFHDVALEDSGLCRVQTSEDLALSKGRYTELEQAAWLAHGNAAAQTLSGASVSDDVLHAVRVHHERPDRSGPLALGHEEVSQLGALVAVAHSLLSYFVENKGKASLSGFLSGPGSVFQKGTPYKKALQLLGALVSIES